MNLQRDFFRFSMNEIGVFLFCIYIFASFLGNDVVFPSEIGTYSLLHFFYCTQKNIKDYSYRKMDAVIHVLLAYINVLFTRKEYFEWNVLFFNC